MVVGGGGNTHGEGHAFDALAHALGAALSVPLVVISLATPQGQDVVGAYESERPAGAPPSIVSATALCRQVVHGAKPVIIHDGQGRIAVRSDALAALGIAGYAGVPVLLGDTAIGAVAALERGARPWSNRDVELLRRFADAVASVVATEAARDHERAVTTLLLRIAAATSVQEVLEAIARHVGWPRAELVTVEGGRVRTLAAHDVDRGRQIERANAPSRDEMPGFAIAIPDSSAVLNLFTGEVSRDPRDLARIAPSVAALVSAVLRRIAPSTGELEVLALHDELTGLLNRRGFYAVAGGQLAIARRKGMPGMVLFVDVDGLKGVNDRDGHSAGDSLLRLAGSVLRSTFREADTIARVGGDEFVVFSIDATDQNLAAVTDRLSSELARANEPAKAASRLRWSVGYVCFDGSGVESLDSLMAEADRRMYATKRTTQLASAR